MTEHDAMQRRNYTRNGLGGVDCEVEHPVYGWVPYTLSDEEVVELKEEVADATSLSTDTLALNVREDRNRLLSETDFMLLPDYPSVPEGLLEYRQKLRDITNQAGFPSHIEWPVFPA